MSFCTSASFAADQSLDGEQGPFGIGDRLALGRRADQHLAVTREGDDRRGGAVPFAVLDDLGFAVLHDGHAGVGGTQVDANDFAHALVLRLGL